MKVSSDVEMVLMNEIDNRDGVYLYLQGNKWCAYERSAYYLASLNVPVKLEKEVCKPYDIVLLKALFNVDDMCLPLAPNTVLKRVADDSLQFKIGNAIEGFPEWKASQLSKMSA